jgi:hypothetical protein
MKKTNNFLESMIGELSMIFKDGWGRMRARVRSAIWTRADTLSTAETGSVRAKNAGPRRAMLPTKT